MRILSFLFCLWPLFVGSQTIYTNKTDFINAISPNPYLLETFEDEPFMGNQTELFFENFDVEFVNTFGDKGGTLCNTSEIAAGFNIVAPQMGEWQSIFKFDSPKNAFGLDIRDFGDQFNPSTLTFVNDIGDEITVSMTPAGDNSSCNEIFFGVITDMEFTTAIFEASTNQDAIAFDNVHCALLSEPIPTLSQWGIMILGMLSMIFGVIALKYSTRFRLQGKQ